MPDGTGFLGADEILAKHDQKIIELEVPEWGGRVRLRTLKGHERGGLEALYQKSKGIVRDFRERFAALCLCDEKGARLFTDLQVKLLGEKSAAALDRIFDAAAKLNHFTKEAVEELEGN